MAAMSDVDALGIEVEKRGWCSDPAFPPQDRDVFFGEGAADIEAAKSHCARCPVKGKCLQLALTIPAGRHHVWGGTTEEERNEMRGGGRPPSRRHLRAVTAAPGPRPRYDRRTTGGKHCGGCKISKPVAAFWSCATSPDGLQRLCKECKQASNNASRRKNRGRPRMKRGAS
jgi:hypothetical protein